MVFPDGIRTLADEEETKALAIEVAGRIKAPLEVHLLGNLGAGKTTFVRYLVGALGIGTPVSSPTYVLMHEYRDRGRALCVEHWDLYRVNMLPEELLEPPAPDTIRIVEWADRFPELSHAGTLTLRIAIEETGRRVQIEEM